MSRPKSCERCGTPTGLYSDDAELVLCHRCALEDARRYRDRTVLDEEMQRSIYDATNRILEHAPLDPNRQISEGSGPNKEVEDAVDHILSVTGAPEEVTA